jgi:hypothetical protein
MNNDTLTQTAGYLGFKRFTVAGLVLALLLAALVLVPFQQPGYFQPIVDGDDPDLTGIHRPG